MFGLKRKAASNRRPDMMIVGLGNPGSQYEGTRHNVGFGVVDEIARRHKVKLTTFKNRARFATWEQGSRAVLLVKPMTFMNLSGQAVAALAKQYSVPPSQILVVSDDLDLETGRVKMKPKGGSGGHNGHNSIAAALRTDEYPRVKIGIGKAGETVDHVLSRFTPSEKPTIEKAIEKSADVCEAWVGQGLDAAMQFCNTD